MSVVAERKLVGRRPDGAEIEIVCRIGVPYRVEEDKEKGFAECWKCPVALEGLYEKLSDAVGGDSWQAMLLGFRLIKILLKGFLEKGGAIYWTSEKERMTEKDLETFF